MRTEGQIRKQLRNVIFRHLQNLTRENFDKRIPERCLHNSCPREAPVSMGFCGHPDKGRPRWMVCDARFPGCHEQARACPLWAPRRTKEQLRIDFQALIDGDRGRLAAEYPDIAALKWMLDDDPFNKIDLIQILSEEASVGDGEPK